MKIGICTLAIGDEYSKAVEKCVISIKNYCNLHDYCFIMDDSVYDGTHPPAFCKIFLVQKYLKYFEYILWIDSDVFITNYGRKVEEFIDLLLPQNFMIIAQHGLFYINTGVFLIRNCKEANNFLTFWARQDSKCFNWEQPQLHKALINLNVEGIQLIPHAFANILNAESPLSHTNDSKIVHWLPGDFLVHFLCTEKEKINNLIESLSVTYDGKEGYEHIKKYKMLVICKQLNVVEKHNEIELYPPYKLL